MHSMTSFSLAILLIISLDVALLSDPEEGNKEILPSPEYDSILTLPFYVTNKLSQSLFYFVFQVLHGIHNLTMLHHDLEMSLHYAHTLNGHNANEGSGLDSHKLVPVVKEKASTSGWTCALHTDYQFLLQPSASRLNAQQLMDLLDSKDSKRCSLVLVFADRCPFSRQAVPVFNALSRLFPNLNFVAIHVNDFWVFRWSLSTFYIPTVKIYSGNRKRLDYHGNDTNLFELVDFIHQTTGFIPLRNVSIEVTARDLEGPVQLLHSTVQSEVDVLLLVCWFLTFICGSYLLYYMNVVNSLVQWKKYLFEPRAARVNPGPARVSAAVNH